MGKDHLPPPPHTHTQCASKLSVFCTGGLEGLGGEIHSAVGALGAKEMYRRRGVVSAGDRGFINIPANTCLVLDYTMGLSQAVGGYENAYWHSEDVR